MMSLSTYFNPPSSLIALVLKLVWQPAPFQLPVIGLGSKETTTPKSSHTLCRMKRAIHKWSPIVMPSHGPTWNSHYKSTNKRVCLFTAFRFVSISYRELGTTRSTPHVHTVNYSVIYVTKNLNPLHLPVQAWLQHWCHRSWPQHTDRLCNALPQHLCHKPYPLPRHSNMVLFKHVNHQLFSETDGTSLASKDKLNTWEDDSFASM